MRHSRIVALLSVSILIFTAQGVFAGDMPDESISISISLGILLRVAVGAVAGFLAGGILGAIAGAVFMFFVNPCEILPNMPIVY